MIDLGDEARVSRTIGIVTRIGHAADGREGKTLGRGRGGKDGGGEGKRRQHGGEEGARSAHGEATMWNPSAKGKPGARAKRTSLSDAQRG